MKIRYKYAAISDIGNVRKNNEDNLFVPNESIREPKKNIYSFNGEYTDNKAFFCVCDGMGGHSAGEVASYIATQQVQKNYNAITDKVKSAKNVTSIMKSFISAVNDSIYNTTEEKPELKSMGTTMTGLYFLGNGAYFVNIGDSRVYELKNKKLAQLTRDHADAENKHALTRFLGMSSQYGKVYPDVAYRKTAIGLGKRFLLCSDGLTDMVDDTMIRDILIEEKNPVNAAEKLVETAKKNGGRDNITVLIIDAEPVNKIGAILKSKITLAVIILAILVGAGVAVTELYKPKTAGVSFTDLSSDIKNAHDLSEACNAMDAHISNLEEQLIFYKDYSDGVDESDTNVAAKNSELKQTISDLANSIADIKSQYSTITENTELKDEDKKNAVTALADNNTPQSFIEACGSLKSEVENQLEAWKSRMAEEVKKKTEAQNNGGGSRSSGTSSSKGSSGGGYSSSGGNSSSYTGGSSSSSSGGESSYYGGSLSSSSSDTGGSSSSESSSGGTNYGGRGDLD